MSRIIPFLLSDATSPRYYFSPAAPLLASLWDRWATGLGIRFATLLEMPGEEIRRILSADPDAVAFWEGRLERYGKTWDDVHLPSNAAAEILADLLLEGREIDSERRSRADGSSYRSALVNRLRKQCETWKRSRPIR